MAAISDYLEVNLIKHIFRTGSYTKPTTLAIALFTADPAETGVAGEVSGGSYARVEVAPADANWAATSGSDGHTSNVADITFPAPTPRSNTHSASPWSRCHDSSASRPSPGTPSERGP